MFFMQKYARFPGYCMKLIGKVLVAILAFASWMWIAPRVWPSHRLLFTLLVTLLGAIVAFFIWPAETFPKT